MKKIAIVNDRMTARYDHTANTEGFRKGQLVLLSNPTKTKRLYLKLQTSFDGPYKIVKWLNDVVYRIKVNAYEMVVS